MSFFYLCRDLDVLAAWSQRLAELHAMRDEAKAFAELFGGEPYFTNTCNDVHFGGVRFSPKMPTDIWTVPNHFGGQRPRAKLIRRAPISPGRRNEHGTLLTLWAEYEPKGIVKIEPVYNALGMDWSDFVISGIGIFQHNGALYIEADVQLSRNVTEILGSEYAAALRANRQNLRESGNDKPSNWIAEAA